MAETEDKNEGKVVRKTLADILKAEQAPAPPKVEDPPPPPPVEVIPPPVSELKPLTWFNEKFKTNFEKDEDLEEHFNSLTAKSTQYDTELEAAKKLGEESVGVFMQEFGITEDQLKLSKAHTVFPDVTSEVLSKVIASDFTQTLKDDPTEILVIKERFEHPELSDAQATKRVYKKYGIDPENLDESKNIIIDDDTAVDIKVDAKEAIKGFNAAKQQVKIPEQVNITKRKEEQTKTLNERVEKIKPLLEKDFKGIPDHLDKVEIIKTKKGKDGKPENEVVYSFSLGDYGKSTYVKKEIDKAVDYLSRTLPEYDQAFVGKAIDTSVEVLKSQRVLSMLPDILLSAKEEWYAQWRKENNLETTNPLQLKGDGAPVIPTEDEKKRADAEAKIVSKNPKLKHKEVFSR
jgi:hypothetical protein